jgi:sulfatase modifying factor 1
LTEAATQHILAARMFSRKTILLFTTAIVVIAAVGKLLDAAIRQCRKQWRDVASMHDLPPLDRSQWPKPPVAWSHEIREIEAATPDGVKKVNVTYFINSVGMKFVQIQAGGFVMGLDEATSKEVGPEHPEGGPMYSQHTARLTKPFFIGAYEATNKQFEQFEPAHVRQRPSYQFGVQGDNHPVQPVSWRQAQEFSRWLSAKEGRLYRLPTEAEWEYACRAGVTNRTYWGQNVEDRSKANLGGSTKSARAHYADDGFEFTAPVGSFPANPWGLYDMIGNAWEYVQDWYGVFATNVVIDPHGPPTGHCRVHKGGSWRGTLHYTSSALRDGDDPGDLKDICGFRVACEVESP